MARAKYCKTTGKLRGPLPIYYLHGVKKLHGFREVFYRGVGKNGVVQYIPPGGEKHEGGGKDYERRPVQLGVSLLSLSPGDTPAS
jgi:hypothetical protein